MIKNFKFSGLVLLVTGLSFAAVGCTKQTPEVCPVAEESIELSSADFSELTKCPQEVIAVSADSIKTAIEEIAKEVEKEIALAGQLHHNAVDSLHVDQFRKFVAYCRFHRYDQLEINDQEGFFNAMFSLFMGQLNGYSYIFLSLRDGTLSLETRSGYYIKVKFPSWIATIAEQGGKFHFDSRSTFLYTVTIGKKNTVYSLIAVNPKDNYVKSYVFDANQVPVAGSCWECNGEEYIWYNNRKVAGDNPTDIKIYDLAVLRKDVKMIERGYVYRKEQAAEIAREFNGNVTSYLISPLPARLNGLTFRAVVEKSSEECSYRVIFKWGDRYVPTQAVVDFLEEWLKNELSD